MPAVVSTRGIVLYPLNQRTKGEIKTMKCSQIALAISGALLSICSLSAQQVKTDYDHSANFSQYKTYSWIQVKTSNSLWDSRVKADVNSALVAKGLSEVPTGGDLAVVASRTSQDQQTLNTFYDGLGGFGGGYGWRGFGRGGFGGGGFGESTTTTETYQVGTLIVDLFDGKTKSLLWRGSASEDLSGNSNNNIKKDEGRVLHALHLRGSKAWPS
jgi:hypothetical protein